MSENQTTVQGLLIHILDRYPRVNINQILPHCTFHPKYEPDLSIHARDKWGVKIVVDLLTPHSCVLHFIRVALM